MQRLHSFYFFYFLLCTSANHTTWKPTSPYHYAHSYQGNFTIAHIRAQTKKIHQKR